MDKESATLQYGRIVNGSSVDRFNASCRFVIMNIYNTPKEIAPNEFNVTNVRSWEDFVSRDYRIYFSFGKIITYEITLWLHSEDQPEVHTLFCKHDDGRYLKASEMHKAVGGFTKLIK